MSFTKSLLMTMAVAANISWAAQEHVSYTCRANEPASLAFSFHYDRDQNWKAAWDPQGDWTTQERPTFDSTASINLPERAVTAKVHGRWRGGYTRLSNYTDVSVNTEDESFNLSIVESPGSNDAFGHGKNGEEYFFVSCTVTVDPDPSGEW